MNSTCRQYVVAYSENDVKPCDNETAIESRIANCNDFIIQYGMHWLRMIASFIQRSENCDKKLYSFRLYPNEKMDQMTADFIQGVADLYPIPQVLKEKPYDNTRSVTAQEPLIYHLYMNARFIELGTSLLSESSFLVTPFGRITWCCVLISIGLMAAARYGAWKFRRQIIRRLIGDRIYDALLILPLVLIGVTYNALLKSFVIKASPQPPFGSLNELADRLQRREIRMVIENENSFRYSLLTTKDPTRPESIQRLVRFFQSNTNNNLRLLDGINAVCGEMLKHSNVVFLGYDELLLTTCTELCVWKFRVKEVSNVYQTFVLGSRSTIAREANLATYALPNFSELLLSRRMKKNCEDRLKSTATINMCALAYAFLLITIGWIAALLLFFVELRMVHPRLTEILVRHSMPNK